MHLKDMLESLDKGETLKLLLHNYLFLFKERLSRIKYDKITGNQLKDCRKLGRFYYGKYIL